LHATLRKSRLLRLRLVTSQGPPYPSRSPPRARARLRLRLLASVLQDASTGSSEPVGHSTLVAVQTSRKFGI